MRAIPRGDEDENDDGRPNLTPLIDIVFLLLVFLILTVRFIPQELEIDHLLPTDRGPSNVAFEVEEIPKTHVVVHPAEVDRHRSVAWYQRFAESGERVRSATVRIGAESVTVHEDEPGEAALERVASFVAAELARREIPGAPRAAQDPVVVHAYSGMPWKYALWAYDAVRFYELQRGGGRPVGASGPVDARSLAFAPPRIRDYDPRELGDELFELTRLR